MVKDTQAGSVLQKVKSTGISEHQDGQHQVTQIQETIDNAQYIQEKNPPEVTPFLDNE